MMQVGSKYPLFHHDTCDHKETCFVCGEKVKVRDNEEGYVRIVGGYVRHTACEVGSVEWYYNDAFRSSEFRELYTEKMKEREEKMATKKKAAAGSIKEKIKRNKNLSPAQKAIKDLIGRVKYLCYMDTNPNASVGWTISIKGIVVSRESAKAKIKLMFGRKQDKATAKDTVIAALEHELSQTE
jgi:hypothetical protein